MAGTGYSKRQVAATRRTSQRARDNRRLRELVADLPFNTIILLQELWERQRQDSPPPRSPNYAARRYRHPNHQLPSGDVHG
jgi:hypothetical protein